MPSFRRYSRSSFFTGLREAEGRIRNVTEAMSEIGHSEALLQQLRLEEDRLGALQADPGRAPASPAEAARRPAGARNLAQSCEILEQ
jgi:hypothetical protein